MWLRLFKTCEELFLSFTDLKVPIFIVSMPDLFGEQHQPYL